MNHDFYSIQERQGFWYGLILFLTLISISIYAMGFTQVSLHGGDFRTAYQVCIIPIVIASLVMGWRGLGVSSGIIGVTILMTIMWGSPETIVIVLESSLIALGVSLILVFFSTSLEITKSRYNSLFESSPTPVFLIDREMCLKDMNAGAISVFGFSDTDLGLPLFRVNGPFEGIKDQSEALKKQIEEHTEGTIELQFPLEDGSFRVMKAFVQPVLKKDGVYIGSILFVADISREINALLSLHEQQEWFSTFFSAMSFGAGIYRKTPSGFEMVDMNIAACHAYGVLRQQVMGHNLDEFGYFTDDSAALKRVMDSVIDSHEPAEYGPAGYTRGGTVGMWKYSVFLLGTGEVVVIYVDMTRQVADQQRILASLQEKETMIKEIHHRVKNNLQMIASLLGLQLFRTDDETAHEILQESRNMVYSMSMTHEKLYRSKDLAGIDVCEYIGSLSDHLVSDFCSDERPPVEVILDCGEKISLNIDAGIPCGLILNELITNSLKYAFTGMSKGEIRIGFQKTDGNFVLKYRDNGCGVSDPSVMMTGDSLGMEIVGTLSEQLDGILKMVSEPGQGVRYEITFPVEGHI